MRPNEWLGEKKGNFHWYIVYWYYMLHKHNNIISVLCCVRKWWIDYLNIILIPLYMWVQIPF